MSLWSSQELEEACLIANKTPDSEEYFVDGISIDTRTLIPGDLFIALSGDPGPAFNTSSIDPRDGHNYILKAVANDAACLMVSKDVDVDCPKLRVEDTLKGLWLLATYARKRMSGKVVGITGSSGKTTAKFWLEELLRRQEDSRTHASIGSLNNHWGVPLSLARMPAESKYGIFEIGTNHPGEISPLSTLVKPDIALLLNVLPAHIGNFEDLLAIQKEKLSIADGIKEGGILILPLALVSSSAEISSTNKCRVVTFGLKQDKDCNNADVYGEGFNDDHGTKVVANILGIDITYRISAGGDHRVLTSLAVMALIYTLGADLQQAARDFELLSSPDGRGNEITVNGIKIIDDSYNANPASMSFAIKALRESTGSGARMAFLGEMLELGEQSQSSHDAVANEAKGLDGVVTIGDGFQKVPGSWGHYSSCREIDMDKFIAQLKAGDTILIKGSNKVFWQSKFVEKLVEQLRLSV